MFKLSHWTPCQASAHGSPPTGIHPGRRGDPSAVYKLLIAATGPLKNNVQENNKHYSSQ